MTEELAEKPLLVDWENNIQDKPFLHTLGYVYAIHTSNDFDFAVSAYDDYNQMKNHLKNYYHLKNVPSHDFKSEEEIKKFCQALIDNDVCRFITKDYEELKIKLRKYVEYYLSR